jgi:hypothetical protein
MLAASTPTGGTERGDHDRAKARECSCTQSRNRRDQQRTDIRPTPERAGIASSLRPHADRPSVLARPRCSRVPLRFDGGAVSASPARPRSDSLSASLRKPHSTTRCQRHAVADAIDGAPPSCARCLRRYSLPSPSGRIDTDFAETLQQARFVRTTVQGANDDQASDRPDRQTGDLG